MRNPEKKGKSETNLKIRGADMCAVDDTKDLAISMAFIMAILI